MNKKRYEVKYILYNNEYSNFFVIEKEKVLLRTNKLWYAKFYFKDRMTIFRDFVKDYHVEVIIYDYEKHCSIARCEYFLYK